MRASALSLDRAPARVNSRARVFGLDVLRAAAILAVLAAHVSAILYPHLPAWFGLIGHGGFYGVELFFVLSGFLIGQILLRENLETSRAGHLRRFYVRRWFRTLPLFWLFLLVNVVIEISVRGHHLQLGEIFSHGFFLRSVTNNHITFFAESWSLAIEEWFYLLFPAALWFTLQFSRRFDRSFLLVATVFYTCSTVLRMQTAANPHANWAEWEREVVVCRFDALMTGMFAAWIALQTPARWRQVRTPAAMLGAGLLIAMYATLWNFSAGQIGFGADNFFARTFRFNLVSLGFALLLPWASTWVLRAENFASVAVRKLALWSYALYLVHLPLIALSTPFFVGVQPLTGTHAALLACTQVLGAIGLSAFLFRYFESPITALRERFAPANNRHAEEVPAPVPIP